MDNFSTFVLGVLLIALAFIIFAINKNNCEEKHCPNNLKPTLVHHKCICAQLPED